MFPQQQNTGQAQGAQYQNFGAFNLSLTGGIVDPLDAVGYLCGEIEVNGFAPNNSTQIQFTLRNPEVGAFVNDATVAVNIKDCDGNVLMTSQSLDYVSSSDGEYQETFNIPSQVANQIYVFTITAVGSDGLLFECPFEERSEYCNC